uniref:Integrase catalytic domain-containing protein n=1 Tax=Caenorhabditis japonica TaxID=281687 RepID=A0A8R1HVR8_CAEJA
MSAVFGIPTTIICDNATNFTMLNAVMDILRKEMRSRIITTTTLPKFHFIPAHFLWAGGVCERIIGLIKKSLVRAGSTKILMTLEESTTVLARCTSIINCRPLTSISAEDDITPLTMPNQFASEAA